MTSLGELHVAGPFQEEESLQLRWDGCRDFYTIKASIDQMILQ